MENASIIQGTYSTPIDMFFHKYIRRLSKTS